MSLSEKEKEELEIVFSAIQVKKQTIVKKYYKSMSKKLILFLKKHIKTKTIQASIE